MFRSQIAEALFEKFSKENEVKSAGTKVSEENEGDKIGEGWSDPFVSLVLEAMKEREMDINDKRRNRLTEKLVDWADKVVCMAEHNTIPDYLLQSDKVEYWSIEDYHPGADYDFIVETIERIEGKVKKLVKEIS